MMVGEEVILSYILSHYQININIFVKRRVQRNRNYHICDMNCY